MAGPAHDTPYALHNHDALELEQYLLENYGESLDEVDTIITSPPYADLIDYGDQNEQIGQQGYESFLDDIREVFRQCYELAADDSTLWIITDTYREKGRLVRLPFDIADELENLTQLSHCPADGCGTRLERLRGTGELFCPSCERRHDPLASSWRLSDHIIWDKQRTRPWRQKGQLRNVYEHVSMYTKSDEFTYDVDDIRITDTDEFARWWVDYPERYHPDGMVPGNVWEYPIPKQGQWGPKENFHPSPYPSELVERILQLTTDEGDVVLDPFAGIGTTLAVAEGLDRKGIGFELNSDFVDYYYNHTLPTVLERYGHVQETLTDSGAKRRRTIWTLRINKYAIELLKLMTGRRSPKGEQAESLDVPWFDDTEIEYVIATADPAKLETKGIEKPSARLDYVHSASGQPETLESIAELQEGLRSDDPGSGDYYDVDFEINLWPSEGVTPDDVRGFLSAHGENPEHLYLYLAGTHYSYTDTMEPSSWLSLVESGRYRRYRSRGLAPLISPLAVDVDNPLGSDEHAYEGRQTDIGWFSEQTEN